MGCHKSWEDLYSVFNVKGENQPAEYKGLLSVDPNSDNVAILLVIVVAGCANPSPDKSQVW